MTFKIGFLLPSEYSDKILAIAAFIGDSPEDILYRAIDTMWNHYQKKAAADE